MGISTLLMDEQFLPAACKLIEAAKKSICISTFKAEITTRPRGRKLLKFFELVFEKSRSGVNVRFLINKITKKGSVPLSNLYAMQEIPKYGVSVHCLRDDRCCHAKILIVDDYATIIGSHNLSVKSCHNNFELSFLFKNDYAVHVAQKAFDVAWENSQAV